jgi:toxin-antitoxin system PIN domain toxin
MPDDLALVDTNVLVYAFFPESEHHTASRSLLDRVQAGQIAVCIVPQVLTEFYAVVTNPKRVTAPRQVDEAIDAIEKILALPGTTLLPVPADLVSRWVDLIRKYRVTGAAVFDLQLVATMLGNGVKTILTFNREHFERIKEVEVVSP